MFAPRYFAPRMFAPRYFANGVGGEEPVQPRVISAPPTGRRIQDPNRTRGERRSRTWR